MPSCSALRRFLHRDVLLRQLRQPLTIDAQPNPLAHLHGAKAAIEPQRILIPPQARPLQPATAHGLQAQRLARQLAQQQRGEAAAAVRRPHEQILEVQAGLRAPRAVVCEEQGHGRDLVFGAGGEEERLCVAGRVQGRPAGERRRRGRER